MYPRRSFQQNHIYLFSTFIIILVTSFVLTLRAASVCGAFWSSFSDLLLFGLMFCLCFVIYMTFRMQEQYWCLCILSLYSPGVSMIKYFNVKRNKNCRMWARVFVNVDSFIIYFPGSILSYALK